MSVTSGFFNSFNGDRKYNAEQISDIFNGIINDGVFASVGTAFGVQASNGITINVGVGRAWFNGKWILNDAILPIACDISEVVLDRIDAVVIEINRSDSVRSGLIQVVKGIPSSSPSRPSLTRSIDVNQYPLAYIYRVAGSTDIKQADITNMVGTSDCPYITGILQVVNIDNIVAQWQDQWDQWFTDKTAESDAETAQWLAETKAEFDTWFESLQVSLDDNIAATLEAQVLELQNRFTTLAKERAVYDDLKDSVGDTIEDSYGSVIEGKTTLSSNDIQGTVDSEELNEVWDALDDKQDKIIGGTNQHAGFDVNGNLIPVDDTTPKRVDIVLSSSGWSGLSQEVTVPGVSANEGDQIIFVVPYSSYQTAWDEAKIDKITQTLDKLTFIAKKQPSQNINAYVVIQPVVT